MKAKFFRGPASTIADQVNQYFSDGGIHPGLIHLIDVQATGVLHGDEPEMKVIVTHREPESKTAGSAPIYVVAGNIHTLPGKIEDLHRGLGDDRTTLHAGFCSGTARNGHGVEIYWAIIK